MAPLSSSSHLNDLLVRLVVNLHGGDHLLYIPQNHVQVLIVSLFERAMSEREWKGVEGKGTGAGSRQRAVSPLLHTFIFSFFFNINRVSTTQEDFEEKK